MAETKKTEAAAAAAPPEAACLTLRQKLVEMRKACPEIVKKQHSDGVSYKYAKIYDVWEKITPIMDNHTGLQGRLTADPELRYTQQGTAITSFTLASDTGRKTKDGKKITNFIECVAWRAQAEFVCKYLSKGRLVLVEGELTSRSYEDKDGNRRKAVEITVDSVHFCDSKKDGGQSSGSDFADPGYSEGSGDFAEIEDNGDLPF